MAFLLRRAFILLMGAEGVNRANTEFHSNGIKAISIIYAIGGAFIALAGLFSWIALPKETYTTQNMK